MKRVHFVLLPILCAMLFGGCGLIPEVTLSEEDSQLVAEYAAGLLLKYDEKHNNGLMEITDAPIVVETPDTTSTPATGTSGAGSEIEETETRDVSGLIAAPELASVIGIPDFDVTYTGYETCDFYPEQESEDLVFSMQAQQGYDLLVLHFDLTNPTDAPLECDVVNNGSLFRALVNDGERLNAQTTILLNDLSVYSGTLEAGETVDTVVVFEIEEDVTAELSSISLLIVGDTDDYTYQLQ